MEFSYKYVRRFFRRHYLVIYASLDEGNKYFWIDLKFFALVTLDESNSFHLDGTKKSATCLNMRHSDIIAYVRQLADFV